MAPDENAVPEVATEVNEEEVAEAGAEDQFEGTVPEVLEHVEGDLEGAREALEEELSQDEPRSTLVEGLESAIAKGEEAEEAEEEELERSPQAQPEHVPSMTDEVQVRMNSGIAQGEETRRATIRRNQARKREQHAAIHATNKPGPSEPAADEEE